MSNRWHGKIKVNKQRVFNSTNFLSNLNNKCYDIMQNDSGEGSEKKKKNPCY